jgi:hypothetical protein
MSRRRSTRVDDRAGRRGEQPGQPGSMGRSAMSSRSRVRLPASQTSGSASGAEPQGSVAVLVGRAREWAIATAMAAVRRRWCTCSGSQYRQDGAGRTRLGARLHAGVDGNGGRVWDAGMSVSAGALISPRSWLQASRNSGAVSRPASSSAGRKLDEASYLVTVLVRDESGVPSNAWVCDQGAAMGGRARLERHGRRDLDLAPKGSEKVLHAEQGAMDQAGAGDA